MWTLENIQSPIFFILFSIALLGTFFWVVYSLEEVSAIFRRSMKNKSKKHLKELEAFREDLKKRN